MVVGEAQKGLSQADAVGEQTAPQPLGIQQATIDNIMSGIENTGAVKMNNHRKKLRQRFDIIKKLGQGTYGKVQLGINKETGQEVAIKTIKKSKIETEADLIRIRREVQIMSSVQHPNIIHIYEVFENREKMVLVMEFAAGGELYDYLSDRKVLTEEEARRIFRQVSTAIYYCHKHKICHRDLKLENILLDEHGNAKIADFGLSNVFDEQRLLATFCGSPLYASPEIVKGTPYQGPEVDCWSLGVLLYTLVYGAMPFDGANFKRLVKQISQGDYFEPKKPSRASPLIREMLTVCPVRRANIEQICNHWWVNEDYNESCLELAEELANQTPVRLDVLLSLAPPSVTSDQVLVPSLTEEGKDRIQKSHSVGSIIDMPVESEAERKILDMVAAGGAQAIMPSATKIITPSEIASVQPKRKLEPTISTENAILKKKEKPINDTKCDPSKQSIAEMDIDTEATQETPPAKDEKKVTDVQESLKKIEELCDELMEKTDKQIPKEDEVSTKSGETVKKETSKKILSPAKRKTSDLTTSLTSIAKESEKTVCKPVIAERQNSVTEDFSIVKPTEKRRSRILETAEKFQNMNNQNNEKYKKFSIPGVSVGNFKKEFERKASLTQPEPRKLLEKRESFEQTGSPVKSNSLEKARSNASTESKNDDEINQCDSKSSVHSFSLEEARRSMENSIALLKKAKTESQSKEIDQLCAKTQNVALTLEETEREKKLRAAREIIGNAIPSSRLIGVRKPPVYGLHGRSISGSVVQTPAPRNSVPLKSSSSMEQSLQSRPTVGRFSSVDQQSQVVPEKALDFREPETTKTSHAEITLKSATLPRRKPTKTETQVEVNPKANLRYSVELQHQVPELRSAPTTNRPYTSFTLHNNRSTSLEPKEHAVHVQKPPAYQRTTSSRNPLSRQSTIDSNESDMTTQSSTVMSSNDKQPIKKSPREFIIPISVEGGGIVTPKSINLEQSESTTTQSSVGSKRISRPRRISSIFTEKDSDDDSAYSKINRHTSIGRESDTEEPRFHSMHRLRSSRPTKHLMTFSQDPNESGSSAEEDDDDGFELLTAENLFSTLLSRVRALTHRLNVNNESTTNFPSTRFTSNLRSSQSPFWNNDPFESRSNMPWRESMARDLHTNFDSMFSRSGATLPRGKIKLKSKIYQSSDDTNNDKNNNKSYNSEDLRQVLDLTDLDLSSLRLTRKNIETLSSLTPNLTKNLQDQLLAQLPPNQAKKLSRTLSVQNEKISDISQLYRRSISNIPRQHVSHRDSITPTNEVPDCNLKRRDDDLINNNAEMSVPKQNTLSPTDFRGHYYSTLKSNIKPTSLRSDSQRICFSPGPLEEKPKQKRLSRFVSPENFVEKSPDFDVHEVLREKIEVEQEPRENRISYFLDKYASNEISKHLLNGNVVPSESNQKNSSSHLHSSVSSTINDKILDELNSISLLNGQLERFDQRQLKTQDKILKKKVKGDETIKKVKKKTKDKSPEDSRDGKSLLSIELKSAVPQESSLSIQGLVEKTDFNTLLTASKLTRPKSFPNSKITPPKDIKFSESIANILNNPTVKCPESEPKKMKKVIKIVKKSSKNMKSSEKETLEEPSASLVPKQEKSPEKKPGRGGLLFTIGQKFEKLRDAKNKEKEKDDGATEIKEKKQKIKAILSEDLDEATRQDRKSKINEMIQNLREKSLSRNNVLTESGLIKRAVSVEEIPNTFNKKTVNKVLGLFKRIEKENSTSDAKVQNTKSTSYLSFNDYEAPAPSKERPKSSGFVHKTKKNGSILNQISESKIPVKYAVDCYDCREITPSNSSNNVNKREQKASAEERERIRNNRKGLMLDFAKFDDESKPSELKKPSRHNDVSPLPHDNNQNLQTYDSFTNCSSPYKDSKTLLSPTSDVGFDRWSTCSEDDHYHASSHQIVSSSLSRLSRCSRNQTHLEENEENESVVDRIRRKSFYSRFNEKKPKRVSNIVGPAAKDYYRERSASRPLEYTRSVTSVIPDTSDRNSSVDTSSHYRSTRHTSSGAARSLSQTRSLPKYSSENPVPNDLQLPNLYRNNVASLPHHHHHYDFLVKSPSPDDISARIRHNRNTMYDSSSSSSNAPSSIYAKRRSYISTPLSSSGITTLAPSSAMKPQASFVDGFAVGRKLRQYNSRTVSLLEPTINSMNSYDHHNRVNEYMDLNSSLLRNTRYRNSSVPRSDNHM